MMRKMFRFLFWVALVLGIVIGFLRLTMLRWWRVPSNDPYLTASISPSVRGGDLILLWRLTRPGFSDLVLCPEPKQPGRVVIGRIAGVGRDEIEVKGADISVNHKRQQVEGNCPERTFTENDPGTGIPVEQSCSIEDLGGSTNYRAEIASGSVAPSDVKTVVPDNQVWLVSDNRQFPYDSRDFGAVPRETCAETVFFRLVSAKGFFDTSTRNQYIR
jgi:signal peptidase I